MKRQKLPFGHWAAIGGSKSSMVNITSMDRWSSIKDCMAKKSSQAIWPILGSQATILLIIFTCLLALNYTRNSTIWPVAILHLLQIMALFAHPIRLIGLEPSQRAATYLVRQKKFWRSEIFISLLCALAVTSVVISTLSIRSAFGTQRSKMEIYPPLLN